MRKSLIALTAAGALAAGTISVPQQAEAHAWWWIPAAIVGGVVLGGAVAHSRAYAYGSGPYGYAAPAYGYAGPQYGVRGAVSVAPVRGCYLQERRTRSGAIRHVEVCR